ncbi:MAG: lactate racemase domain-containing protein [Planctomycetota bacterium]|jgi:nickel-dependent lactate racemase
MAAPANIDWQTVGPVPVAETRDGVEIVTEALERSVEVDDFLDRAASDDELVVLVVNDGHRSTRTRDALIALAGVLKHRPRVPRFRALVATGTHRFPERERREFEELTFGEGKGDGHLFPERPGGCGAKKEPVPFSIAWHDAFDAQQLVDLTGVRVHPWLAEGRFLLPIGSVEPHYFAGATGAHKTVTIGCMSREDIERNHAHALSAESDILRLKGNPVYDGIVQILRSLQSTGKKILAINEVVRDGAVIAAAAGEPLDTLKTLLPTVQRVYLRQVSLPVDLLRLRVPLPLGRNLYQADKALKNNHRAVRDGGGILLEAECPEGVGPDAFLNLLRRADSYAAAVQYVRDHGYQLGDHKAVKLRYLTDPSCRGVHVALVSSDLHRLGGPSLQRWGMQLGSGAPSSRSKGGGLTPAEPVHPPPSPSEGIGHPSQSGSASHSPTSKDVGHPASEGIGPPSGIKVFKDVGPALEWLLRVVSGPLERGLIVEDAGWVSTTKSQKVETSKRRKK